MNIFIYTEPKHKPVELLWHVYKELLRLNLFHFAYGPDIIFSASLGIYGQLSYVQGKETRLGRADFTLQLLMFVRARTKWKICQKIVLFANFSYYLPNITFIWVLYLHM